MPPEVSSKVQDGLVELSLFAQRWGTPSSATGACMRPPAIAIIRTENMWEGLIHKTGGKLWSLRFETCCQAGLDD